ncbi:MAG TPA: cysteine hydrolase [Burkholderiales bacterium]|nr:cysteine hydrolase [Burkholderiales bacterium]
MDRLDPRRTALVLFDILNGHVKTRDAEARWRPVIAAAATLLAGARARGVMVAYACAAHRADNATSAHTVRDADNRLRPLDPGAPPSFTPVVAAGSWGAQIVDELAPEPQDYVVPKYRWSAFHQTYLDLALRTRGIDTVVLAGGSTDVGVASTAYAARDLDYNLVVAADACTSPERDNHEQFVKRVFPRMARVRTAAQVVAMLSAT